MENDVKERILTVFDYYSTNPNQLAGQDTAFQNRLSRQLKQGATLSCDTILRILNAYPSISSQWLLLGVEPMLISGEKQISNDNDTTQLSTNLLFEQKKVRQLELENNKLEIQKEYLEEYNARLITELEKLKDDLRNFQNDTTSKKHIS